MNDLLLPRKPEGPLKEVGSGAKMLQAILKFVSVREIVFCSDERVLRGRFSVETLRDFSLAIFAIG